MTTKRKRTNEANTKKTTEPQRQNLLRNTWVNSSVYYFNTQFYEYFLTDEGERDFLDLNGKEVSKIWHQLLLYQRGNGGITNQVLRSCFERLMQVYPEKGLGSQHNHSSCFRSIIHYLLEQSFCSYFISNFPDIVLEMIQKAPRNVFFNKISRTESKQHDAGSNRRRNSNTFSTLLHLAAWRKHIPLWLLKEIYEAYPRAISQQDAYERLPLHAAMERCETSNAGVTNEAIELLKFLFSKYPSAAVDMDTINCIFPLHQLYVIWSRVAVLSADINNISPNNTMVDTVTKLAEQFLEVCPMAARAEMPNRGGIPLHFVCRRSSLQGASKLIIDLLKCHPDGIFYKHRKSIRGFTPLQLLRQGASTMVLSELCQQQRPSPYDGDDDSNNNYNNGLLARTLLNDVRNDKNGNTVLHVLFRLDQDARSYKQAIGEDPLYNGHLRHGFVSVFSQLTMERNSQGDTPLQVRLHYGSTKGLLEDVKALVENGETSTAVTLASKKKLYPFMLAASRPRKDNCLSTTFFLLQRYVVLRGGINL